MEEFISRIIQADLGAQEKIKQREEMQLSNKKRVLEEKEKVFQTCWDNAKAYVEKTKAELDRQVIEGNEASEKEYEEKVKALHATFDQHKELWRKEIMQRCLQ